MLWRQQVEPYINAHNLDGFIVAPIVPPHFLNAQDRATGTLNPAFRKWRLTDQMLLSWLQSTLSSAILARFIGCSHAYELWDKLVAYFHKQMRAKARQLRVELRSTSLANLTVQDYLLRIHDLVDNLASVGDPVPVNQHLDVILEGLPQDFSPVIFVVESKFDVIDVDEVESLLLAHETRLDKFKKVLEDVASINLTSSSASQASSASESSQSQASVNVTTGSDHSTFNPNFTPNFGSNRVRGGRSGRGRGRGGRLSNFQCQVCFRFGHPASTCWHRFNQQFQPQIPPNFQGFQRFNNAPIDPYHLASPIMMPYGAPYGGYNQHSLGYGSFNNWPRPSAQQRPPSVQFSQPSAMMINAPSRSGSSTWFPDSAASFHVTGDARNIQE